MKTHLGNTRSLTASLFLALSCLLFGHVLAIAQERPPRQQPDPPASHPSQIGVTVPLVEPLEDYRLGPGDVIDIQIDRAPELSGTFRVSAIGNVMMQYLGNISVLEKTQDDVAFLISEGLRGRYLKNPRVTVNVRQMNSHSFFIQGAVNRPGVYQMEGRPSLMKLITVAGGLTENHGSTAYIIRELRPPSLIRTQRGPEGQAEPFNASRTPSVTTTVVDSDSPSNGPAAEDAARYELTKTNVSGLFKGRFDQNVFLAPGTIVHIPPTDVFFVAGEVNAPGSFPLKEGTTLRQAISLAQGTTIKAALGNAVIFRDDPNGTRREIRVNVGQVMSGKGKTQDVPISANDIIIVPNSRFKSVGSAMLTAFGYSAARVRVF